MGIRKQSRTQYTPFLRHAITLADVPVFELPARLAFPNPALAEPSGLLAVGGDLSPQRLLLAYANGIFPWYETPPIRWWSPPVRPVLDPAQIHVPRSLSKVLRRGTFDIRLDNDCAAVIAACAEPRDEMGGTWITPEMQAAYLQLHELGFVHSAEAWQAGQLCGGLYGVALGGTFFGESMFAKCADASKAAFVVLCQQLARWGFELVDCQVSNPHTARFGTTEISREEFLERIAALVERPTRRGRWRLSD